MKHLRLTLLIPLLAACLGRATPPEQIKLTQAQNEVLGKFARQVGERELNILLKDPNDSTLPGLPVGDLLFILSKVSEDRLIQLVKGVSATTVLELILAIKRVGCTRANTVPSATGYGFDARSVPSMNTCKWQQFHIPNIMVQLLNGADTNGMTTLIDTLKHSYTNLGLPANRPLLISLGTISASTVYNATVAHHAFLMKLAYVVVGFDTPTSADPNLASPSLAGPPKLYNLMNLTKDGRDMVFLLDSLDKQAACPGTATANTSCVHVDTSNTMTTYNTSGDLWQDLVATHQMQDTQSLLSIMNQVTNTAKMATLVNGYRTTRYATGEDEAQARYFVDRLKVTLYHNSPACVFPGTAAEQALQNYNPPALGGTAVIADWNSKLASMINLIGNVDRMMDLVYNIDDGFDSGHNSIGNCPNRGIDNLLVMVHNINGVDAHASVANTTNNEIITAAYLIDNVGLDPSNDIYAKRNKVKYLAENIGTTLDVLQLACYTAVADQADGVAPADGTPETCDNRGMLNLVASGSKLSDSSSTDLTAAGQKMVNLIGQVNNIEDVRFLVRKLTMKNMSDLMAGLLISGTGNVSNLINQISGNDCWASGSGVDSSPIGVTGVTGAFTYDVKGDFTNGGTCTVGTSCATAKALRSANPGSTPHEVIVLAERGPAGTYYYPAAPPAAITIAGLATGTPIMGRCFYDAAGNYRGFPAATSTGATGLGKMVNVVNHLTGSITNLVTLINGVTDGQKLGILINGISRSSNLVGVMNATVDTTRGNNATITDMLTLVNTISRVDTYKLVHMIDALGDATEFDVNTTIPAGDHDNVAQLLANYARTGNLVNATSGVGAANMATLISSLSMTGGGGFPTGSTNFTFGVGAAATYNVSTDGAITSVRIITAGSGCTTTPSVTVGGSGTGAVLVPFLNTTGGIAQVNIVNSGSGFTANPIPLTIVGGGCTVAPTIEAYYAGIGSVVVTNGGTAGTYTTSQSIVIAGGSYSANATATVSGSIAINGLSNISGGTGYVNGQICPLVGAGGTGGTCTAVVAGGVLTGCTNAVATGSNYAAGRIVKVGGNATAVATITAGAVTGFTITNSGCGYSGAPVVQVTGCTINPGPGTATVTAGRITLPIAGGTGGSGCTAAGVKITIGEAAPYAYHADGASALVGSLAPGTGVVTSISVSDASINAAQLVQLLDRDATGTGIAINYRPDDAAWTPTSACQASGLVPTAGVPCIATDTLRPNISTREALIRLLHHGVTPTTTSSKSYFNGILGAGGPADIGQDGLIFPAGAPITAGNYSLDWPGIGAQHIAGAILNNVTSSSTQSLITLMNSDIISLEDTIILLGCGDHVTYTNGWVPFTWQQLCSELGPGIW